MVKIGSYDFPEMSVSEAVRITKMIYENSVETASGLATRLGHKSPESGSFKMKLASLRRYNLIKSGISGIGLTPLGEKIAKPTNKKEQMGCYKEILNNVPLFSDIRKKLSGKTPGNDFWIYIHELTKVNRKVAEELANKIKQLYLDAQKYMSTSASTSLEIDPDSQIPKIKEESLVDVKSPSVNEDMLEIKQGTTYIRITKDLKVIKRVKDILTIYENELKDK